MGAQNFGNSDNQVCGVERDGEEIAACKHQYRFENFPLLVTLPMESPVLVQKPFAWNRDEIMRALHCDYTQRADLLRDVEQALEENVFTLPFYKEGSIAHQGEVERCG